MLLDTGDGDVVQPANCRSALYVAQLLAELSSTSARQHRPASHSRIKSENELLTVVPAVQPVVLAVHAQALLRTGTCCRPCV